jgi:hypothetical protein
MFAQLRSDVSNVSAVSEFVARVRLRQAPLAEARDEGVAFVLDLTERPRMLRCLRLRQILANKAFLLRLHSSGAKSKLQPTLRPSGTWVDRFSVHEVRCQALAIRRPPFPSGTSCPTDTSSPTCSAVSASSSNAQSSVFSCPEG